MDLLNVFLVTTSVCAFTHTLHLVYLHRIRLQSSIIADTTSRKKAQLLRVGPAICSVLATTALIVVPILGNPRFESCPRDDNEINPDVGGIGVLLGLFLPCLVLLAVLFLGHFTVQTSGAKELCMAQCANLLYLTVNLAKGMSGLNEQELVIALSSIDAVSASISMAFSDKDVLAARKLVGFGFLTQLSAYVVEAVAFSAYLRREDFQCRSSTTDQLLPQYFSTVYWVYLSFRIMASILPCQVAYRLTSSLNKIENKSNATRSRRVKATAPWRSLPATLSISYLVYWSFVLLHGLSVFNTLRGTNTIGQSWYSLTSEWGQSANAIIAVFAICHVAYAIFRLFTTENMDDRMQTARLSGQPVTWAKPQQGWTSWRLWVCIKQRWPFSTGLDYSDHLLVDEGMLQRVINPPLNLDPEVRKKLWQELIDGFTYNDPDGIIDCLDQGAPVDEPNDDGDYPIRLAARHDNTEILMRTRFRFTGDPVTHDSLLLKNSASETPLEIACNTGTLEAVRWIMERLPQESKAASAAVLQTFKVAILGEKEGILKILQHLWPNWRALEIVSGRYKLSLLRFAIDARKAKPAYRLIDPAVTTRRQPNARRIFELSWKSELQAAIVEMILDDRQDLITRIDTEFIDKVIASRAIDNIETLELLLDLRIEPLAILRQSIDYAISPGYDSDQTLSLWEFILQEGYTFKVKELDSILAFHLPVGDDVSHLVPPESTEEMRSLLLNNRGQDRKIELEKDQVRMVLSRYGGRDWSKVVTASTFASTKDLPGLIESEGDPAMLQRMLNVKDKKDRSLLRYTVSQGLTDRGIQRKRRLEYIDILLKHGGRVEQSDLKYARDRSFRLENDIMTVILLATYAKQDVTSVALRTECSASELHFSHLTLMQVLLRCGASPTLTDENGRNPRHILQETNGVKSKRRGDELGKQRLEKIRGENVTKALNLLQRWEDYHNDAHSAKPSERPDEDWKALRDSFSTKATWAWLVKRNPEGFKVVDDQ